MKYRKILLILAIATLSLTACKKEENPAPAEATAIEETKEETEPIVENDENMETITNADRGAATGDAIEAPATEADGIFENEFVDYTKTDESLEEYEVIVTEQLDTNLYVIKEADILKLDQEGAGAISPVEIGAYLTVTGKTSNGWYEIQWNQLKGYLPADVLSTENPIQNTANPEEVVNQETGMTTQETLEKFEEIMKGFDDGSGGGISQEVLDNATVAPDYDKTPAW